MTVEIDMRQGQSAVLSWAFWLLRQHTTCASRSLEHNNHSVCVLCLLAVSRPLNSLASEINEHEPQHQLQQYRKVIGAAKTTVNTTGKEQVAARLHHGSGTRYHP